MSEAIAEIKLNLVGRVLGRDKIVVSRNSLAIQNRGGAVEFHQLNNCKEFATYTNSVFGGILSLKIDEKVVRYRFLKNSGADNFIKSINSIIGQFIGEYLSGIFSEFYDNVINAYPRDSRLHQIADLCQKLNDHYQAQVDLWERYLGSDCIRRINEIISFAPVNAEALRDYHEKIQLEKRRSFFDRVESYPLTNEQRLGVLRSNDRNMVLAAAGTGKTSVIVAKALDLIDRRLALPSEILVLAYNRSAADELKSRLREKAEKGGIELVNFPHISTFHALGRKILRESGVSTYMSVFTEDESKFKQWVTSWIESYLASDRTKLFNFISLFPEPINPFDFRSQAEYERYVRDNEFRTFNGERVKGYQELLIANFLFSNSIPYEYEAPYVSKRRIEVGFDYRPDFHVKNTNIYVEHFGIDRQGRTRPGIDSQKYNESISSKRKLHVECETTLIETFHYEWVEDMLLPSLKGKLEEAGVEFKPLNPEEVLNKLREEGLIAKWSGLMKKALQAIRVERLTKDLIFERLKNSGLYHTEELSELLHDLHEGYVNELKNQNSIDFDDMIIRTIQVIDNGRYMPCWKYVLVDEFQDISAARMEFVKAIVDKGPEPSLTVVGDDWQSIYRFSGGKLELTTRFGEVVGKHSSTKLQKTFRYNNSISHTAGTFIMENPEQYKKQIDTHDKVYQSQVYLLDDNARDGSENGICQRVKEVVQKVRENDQSGSIAIIARYNYLITDARNALVSSNLESDVYFWTFHKSKGLEADYCILIGFFQGRSGFPNENKDEAIIEALLPTIDSFPHSEERRLLYVGITRAKKKSYIIANPKAPSGFVTELLSPKYELKIVSNAFQEQYRKIFKCPNCEDGYLRLVDGKFGAFYTCSTGPGCKVGKARVCPKCGAPAIDGRSESTCQNVACGSTIPICEKCGRPMKLRDGKFGHFWGCTGYGIKDDQCKHTRKY